MIDLRKLSIELFSFYLALSYGSIWVVTDQEPDSMAHGVGCVFNPVVFVGLALSYY